MNFHGSYIDVVGADNTQDRFYDTNRQFDLSATQKVARNLRVYVDLLNLNDSLLRYFQGVPERVLQEEHYHWTMNFGVKVSSDPTRSVAGVAAVAHRDRVRAGTFGRGPRRPLAGRGAGGRSGQTGCCATDTLPRDPDDPAIWVNRERCRRRASSSEP